MKAVKAVRFDFKPSKQVLSILSTFRQMCNDAIRIAIGRGACSRFNLIDKSYEHLKGYALHTHYILNACEIAYAVYERWRQDLPDDTRKSSSFRTSGSVVFLESCLEERYASHT